MNKGETFTYKFEGNLYINLTNKCSNSCTFCLRNNGEGIGGNVLWLKREPTASEVIDSIKRQGEFNEAVFCGYGESTYRLNEVLEVGRYLKDNGHKTRLDTNGHGSLINGYDIVDSLVGIIDTVSISLNQADEKKYNEIAQPKLESAYEGMLEFARECVRKGINTILSVVDVIDRADIEKSREIANAIGATLRVREYIK